MRVPEILCTMLLCTTLAREGAAAALSARNDSSLPAADATNVTGPNQADPTHAREAADGRTLTGSAKSPKAERGQDRQPALGGSDKNVGSAARNPGATAVPHRDSAESQHGSSRLVSPNADRLRSLLNARPRGRITRQPSRASVGPVRAATDKSTGIRGSSGPDRELRSTPVAARPAAVSSGPASVASGMAARGMASPSAFYRAVRGVSTIGGPPVTGHGFVGGPAIGRTARNATIDGTQLHRPR